MSRIYSMAYLTANGLPPLQAVTLAAKLGFDRISFRLLPAGPGDTPPPLLTDDSLLSEVMAAMRDTGLAMSDAEMIRLDGNTDLERFRPFLARCKRDGRTPCSGCRVTIPTVEESSKPTVVFAN